MLLELDDIGVGNNLGVGRGQNGRGVAVNGLIADAGRRCSVGREGEGDEASHCEPKGKEKSIKPATSRTERESRNEYE
jgi:hypothetical protein